MQEREECYHEAHVLVKLDSPYIIKYYDAWVEQVRVLFLTVSHLSHHMDSDPSPQAGAAALPYHHAAGRLL